VVSLPSLVGSPSKPSAAWSDALTVSA
jgi:hypothetical protein